MTSRVTICRSWKATAKPWTGRTVRAWPSDLDWNGEIITCSAPGGSTSPQTLTVTARGVDASVARSHSAGEVIDVAYAATFTSVTFGASSEVIDRDTQHSTASNTSRVVIGDTLGWYKVSGLYVTASNSATTLVRCGITFNGTIINGSCASVSPNATSSVQALATATVLVEATSSTDYVELQGLMTAGSGTIGTAVGAQISPSLTVEYVGKS